jgi:Flp pilus assembly protein TadG
MNFWKNEDGAVFIYVTVALLALFGLSAIALDTGRVFNLRHEVQQAADAAALAGAWQLDGTLAGSQKADAAARTTPIVTNNQKFGNATGAVGIASTSFWSAVPASDDAPLSAAAPPYDFIEVTTSAVVQNTLLMRVVGAAPTVTLTAKAVARKGKAVCQVTPLFMCLPGGASFDPTLYIGHQVQMKAPQGGSWTNGNWGLLDTPGGSQSSPALAAMIAGTNGLPQCIGSTVDTKPGNVASISPAFNIRLDMYENLPGPTDERTTAGFPPAENVIKGKAASNATCSNHTNVAGTAMPNDNTFNSTTRLGDGQWNCATWWNANHPSGPAAPAGCGPLGSTTISRYEAYLNEVTSNSIAAKPPSPEEGRSTNGTPSGTACYTGGPIPPTPTAIQNRWQDRRIFTVAGVDCTTISINGNTPNVPVLQYLTMFLTKPAVTQGANNGDVYMEIVGYSANGGGGLAPVQLREWVELVR